jgi:hypothetical protein
MVKLHTQIQEDTREAFAASLKSELLWKEFHLTPNHSKVPKTKITYVLCFVQESEAVILCYP